MFVCLQYTRIKQRAYALFCKTASVVGRARAQLFAADVERLDHGCEHEHHGEPEHGHRAVEREPEHCDGRSVTLRPTFQNLLIVENTQRKKSIRLLCI